MTNPQKHTHPVSDTVFRAVYDSPASLPGDYKWVTSQEDVSQIDKEKLLMIAQPQHQLMTP